MTKKKKVYEVDVRYTVEIDAPYQADAVDQIMKTIPKDILEIEVRAAEIEYCEDGKGC